MVRGALKSSGTPGFADVWKQGHFGFEYKKKKKNLGEALKQLSQYAWNLENPPLNVACDTIATRIVTVWTNTLSKTMSKVDAEWNPVRYRFHKRRPCGSALSGRDPR